MLAWENFLRLQEKSLGADSVQKWLRTLKVVHFDACNLFLETSDAFQIHWFEEHVRKSANQLLLNNNKKKIKVHLSLVGDPPLPAQKKGSKKGPDKESAADIPKFSISFDELDPHCTFEHFISTDASAFAFKLLCKTVEELNTYNPIYLHGGTGSGKTHLLMAVAHALRAKKISAVYTRAETFTEHVVTAIRAGEMSLFRQSYRNADVLLIDDVHVFGRKIATQEELFHTFNTLHLAGKQIILSANCTPSELTFIEPRLVSRFEWGIVIPIEAPSREILKTIIKAKASAFNCSIPPQVVDLLVELFPSSCKAVVRAVEALVLRSHFHERNTPNAISQFSADTVKRYLADLIAEEQRAAMTPQKILQTVTEFFAIPQEEVLGKSQSRECVIPRQIAMLFCRTELQLPFKRIGEIFGRDHSTVMSSIKLIQKGLENNDPNIAPAVHALQKKLKI